MRSLLFLFSLLIWLSPNILSGQDCSLSLSGYTLDKSTKIALPFSNVFIKDLQIGTVSDSLGFFKIENLCVGEIHLESSHIGCETEHIYLVLKKDTAFTILLHHHSELLNEVVVHGSHSDATTEKSSSISRNEIIKEGNSNFSDILENITGVSTLKNGSGISKPVVHGLFGNRVAIFNNGIAQAGQQWGNDHAPEIDPFAADHLSVIKGASALAYSGNALGSIILAEMGDITNDPHLQGNVNYIFESNGFGHTLNAQVERNDQWAAWRASGTLKLKGDSRTPDYYLTNTGKREGNFALQVEKKISQEWHTSAYYSLFSTEIGVLRGSHIGNLTDLESALQQAPPFFTIDTFSYDINAPRQQVQHHLLKLESKYFLSENQSLRFQYGGQLNRRKEFDIRRGNRSDIPALSLNQFSHFLEGVYQQELHHGTLIKTGIQFRLIDNANLPGTGISPLIPRYKSYHPSAFFIFQKEKDKWLYEIGTRYDFKYLDVTNITNTIPKNIETIEHQFHNYAFSGGLKYQANEQFKTNLNLGFMMRAPEVNELYSSGLHQGVSGIEEGQRDLQQEQSLKLIWSLDWFSNEKFFVQALAYFHQINDYIYLQAQEDFRLTIRGAFPVFKYEQTNARLLGTDIQLTYEPYKNLKLVSKYAIVRGQDTSNDLPLVNIPADNLFTSVKYSFNSNKKWSNPYISMNGKYVWEQRRLEAEQDFVRPPDAYFLLGLQMGTSLKLKESKIDFTLRANNLLHTSYRDYLNRLRYFADEPGINISFGVNYHFKG